MKRRDFLLSEKDLTEHRHFPDAVAYGGWSLDEAAREHRRTRVIRQATSMPASPKFMRSHFGVSIPGTSPTCYLLAVT